MEDYIQNNKLTLLGKLTAGLLHEIRNPLTVIKLNLDYLNMFEKELSAELRESIASSLEAFERINFIISDVLDFTRKSGDRQKSVSINSVAERAIDIISFTASKRNINIIKQFDPNIPEININENKLLQVMLNLINNSIEASKDKSVIYVKTSYNETPENKKIVWEVEDFGCGIKEEDKEKILAGFYTSKIKGSGVGLTVCKRLLEEMGGQLGFDSEFGKGSRFFIKFIF
ncbi:two-component system sensor histidine kinase NtrB [Melioribacter sp. OK-6-Me]|uniref:two-component system sensor histidine kinase NtrB n=1 Tax=unclassified Melioribacter TaxID=2627329 RepID=UPI003EDB1C93